MSKPKMIINAFGGLLTCAVSLTPGMVVAAEKTVEVTAVAVETCGTAISGFVAANPGLVLLGVALIVVVVVAAVVISRSESVKYDSTGRIIERKTGLASFFK